MKYLSLFTIFVICFFNFFSYTLFVQASSFYISSQKVSTDTSSAFTNQQDELNVLPNQEFRFESFLRNETGNQLSNIIYYSNYTNGIIYNTSTTAARQINGAGTYVIPTSEFNPNSLTNYENSDSLLENSSTYMMRRILLRFPENWSTYENTLSNHFTASGGYISDTKQTKIYVNVAPHIIDYYFEKSDGSQTINQIQGNDSEPINLVLKVKDYNLCSNISAGTITANLSQLGLGANESLSYDSCEADGKIAVFKKTGITTSVDLGNYSFNNTHFTAIDSDGNQNNPSDTRFGTEDKTSPISIEVVPSLTPVVDFVSLTENLLGGPEKQTSELTVNSTYSGNIQAKIGSDTNCNGGTVIEGITTYTENTNKSFTINASDLFEGINNIYVCLEKDGYIGSLSREIRLDETAPTITNPSYTVNVGLNDSNITFTCSEDGYFAGELRGTSTLGTGVGTLNWTSTTAGTINTYTALNSNLLTGPNEFHVFCRDNATNISYKTGSITKTIPVLSMNGLVDSLTDNDFDNEGLDGRDISISWQKPAGDISNFYSYQLYILPSNITFDVGTHGNNHITYIQNPDTINFTGNSTITKDSTNTSLVSGTSYKACIAIRGDDLSYGEIGCSPASILTSDTVEHATVTSAKFTSDTNLELTTDTTLDTDLSSHSGALISYVYNSNTLNPTGVASVDGTKINLTIPSLANLGATGTDIIVSTGALRSNAGGYNNHHTFATITDGQAPSITGFANNTASIHESFFSGYINVGFSFAETMRANGYTKITFDRTAGNTSTQKSFAITDPAKLANGAHTQNIDLSSILVSGTSYDMKLVGQDLAGNSVISSAITVKFDNVGPTAPSLIDAPNTSSQTPTLSWNASIDDSGNGSGVKEYIIKIYNSADCSGGASQTLTSATTSKTSNSLSNGTYSWNVVAVDNMNNIGTTSSCDSFMVDTSIPTISNLKITDTTNSNSTSHTKSGNTLQITAKLTNTEISKIKADLSALTGNASHTGIVCDSPLAGITCSYNAGLVTYGFNVGFAGIVQELVRQIKLIVSNPSEVTTVEQFSSITVDNTAPTGGDITGPTGTIGGNENEITFTNINDANLASVELGYTLSGSNYTFIHSGSALVSPYTWDTTSLVGGEYKITITTKDKSGNQTIKEGSSFIVDKSAPTISSGAITSPTNGQYIKGNQNFDITWNSGSITDDSLAANPITLEYSTNNGANWSEIATDLPNSGTYSWNIGNINGSQAKLRIKAIDTVGNESDYDTTSYSFTIDSSAPIITFSEGTPPNGAFINDSGFQAVAALSDNIGLDSSSYSLERISDNNFWNGSSWTGSEVFNTITGTINSVNYNINELIKADITNGVDYDFTLKSTDKAGNENSTTVRRYTADIVNPTLNITTASGTYFSGSLNIVGTSSDVGAGISNVSISIKKGTDYWNGSAWVADEQKLLTTSADNYTNWSYNFTPSSGDIDGQDYEVTVIAYDKSYKVNNETSSSINIALDKTGPVIDDNLFTFDTDKIYAGGENLNITWNTGVIIDNNSGLAINPIKLEYYNGTEYTLIAKNLANNGTYSWTLASIDRDDVIIKLTAVDNVGNISSKNSNPFTIDSTPPTITSIETMDMSTSGKIDALKVTMSEDILDSTIDLNNFSISDSIGTPASWETGNTANDNIFILKFTDSGTTSTTPTLTYTKENLTDKAGRFLENVSNFASIDKAIPRVLQADIFDINNNGKFDKIKVTFSENLSNTTDTSTWSLNNILAGISINSVSISGDTANIILTEGSNFDTSIGSMNLDFTANSNYKDSSNNQAGSKSNIELIDKANPIILSAEYIDSDINYKADKVNITLSENVVGFDINDFSIAGLTKNNGSISRNRNRIYRYSS